MKNLIKITFVISSIFLVNTSLAYDDVLLKSESSYVSNHENRFSFMIGVNPSITKAQDVTNLSASYGKKMEEFWFDSNLIITNGVFNKLTTNNPTATGLTSAQLQDTKSTITTIGAGIGKESHYIQNLLPFKDLYEYMAANITYNIYKEKTTSQNYSGPGMIAKFSTYKRFADYWSFGGQFIYSIAPVKRAQNNALETSSSRSLTLSYLTVGFDLSIYL